MTLESQVCSLELAKKLKELGVPQKGLFVWYTNGESAHLLDCPDGQRPMESKTYSAYTVAELGDMLPRGYRSGKAGNPKQGEFKVYVNVCYSAHRDGYSHTTVENTEADARTKMLIYLLENKLITL